MTLIVVSGAPGTGKSTIARELGADLRFCVLSLDPIKEALADILGLGDEDWSNRVGDAAAEVVFRLAAGFPDAIAEGWWRGVRRDRAVAELSGVAGRATLVAGCRGAHPPHAPGRRAASEFCVLRPR